MERRNLRGAVPIRTLVFAAVVFSIYIWAVIGFIGSYSLSNNLPLNATLKADYVAITGTNATQIAIQGQNIGQTLNTGTPTISTPTTFLTSIPQLYGAIAQLVASPLTMIGINVSPIIAQLSLLIVIIIVLAILTAFFIVPI
jgi:hypothetical protein